MVALWVTLAVLAAIYVLLLFPIRITANLCREPEFIVRYLFFKFRIIPGKEKQKKEKRKKKKPQTDNEAKKPKPKKHHGISYYADKYGDIIKAILKASGKLLKRMVIKQLSVNIVVGDEDAATTAIEYGAVCAVVYPIVSMVESGLTVKERKINIITDFDAKTSSGELYVDMHIRVLQVIAVAAGFLKQLIKFNLK